MKNSTSDIIESTTNNNVNICSSIPHDDDIYNPQQLLEFTNTQGRYQKRF